MDIVRSKYTDLIFHIFAHMKINNASDIYDEAYVENTEKESGIRTVISGTGDRRLLNAR